MSSFISDSIEQHRCRRYLQLPSVFIPSPLDRAVTITENAS